MMTWVPTASKSLSSSSCNTRDLCKSIWMTMMVKHAWLQQDVSQPSADSSKASPKTQKCSLSSSKSFSQLLCTVCRLMVSMPLRMVLILLPSQCITENLLHLICGKCSLKCFMSLLARMATSMVDMGTNIWDQL